MSLMLSIGADPQDLQNIKMTRDLLMFMEQATSGPSTIVVNNSVYEHEEIKSLLSWYNDIHSILCNGGNLEDTKIPTLLDSK